MAVLSDLHRGREGDSQGGFVGYFKPMSTPISTSPAPVPPLTPAALLPGLPDARSVPAERFEILGELGRGGMAVVYLARDRTRGERVALKVLHQHLAADSGARARLVREVRAAGRIRHPGVLVAHEIHELNGRLALSMPVHMGGTLTERLERGPLGAEALRRVAVSLAETLAAAHRAGVIHRDITPNNVLLDEAGMPLLADFGLARLEGAASATASALGTWGYTAPEVYDGKGADPRADLYSLGAVLYAGATGRGPFEAEGVGAVLRRQLASDYTPLSAARPDLPADLVATIEGMLSLDPSSRPQGAREVEEALRDEAPPEQLPAAAPQREGVGYTVVVSQRAEDKQRRKALRRHKGTITREEPADPERTLARITGAITGRLVDWGALPAAMRKRRFDLVRGEDYDVATQLAEQAMRTGFEATVVADQHANRRRKWAIPRILLGMFLTFLGCVDFLILVEEGGGGAFFLLLGMGIPLLITSLRRRTKLAFPGASPAGKAVAAEPMEGIHQRVEAQLLSLSQVLDAASGSLPTALISELRRTQRALAVRADDLRRQTALAGSEDVRTRLAAGLLEIGAAAARATRELRQDTGAPAEVSARAMLEQLDEESQAAAAVLRELEGPGRFQD